MSNFAKMSPVTVEDLLFIRDGALVLDLPRVRKICHISKVNGMVLSLLQVALTTALVFFRKFVEFYSAQTNALRNKSRQEKQVRPVSLVPSFVYEGFQCGR